MLAVVFGLERFCHYTYGRKATVVTDHKHLSRYVPNHFQKHQRLHPMLLKVQEYNFEVVFKPGSEIPVTDNLSRTPTSKPIYTEVVAMNNIKEDTLDEIRGATLKDDILKILGDMILRRWPNEKQHVPEMN